MTQIAIILVVLLALTFAVSYLGKRLTKRQRQWMLIGLGAVYIFGNLYFTLLTRTPGETQILRLVPFNAYKRIAGNWKVSSEPIENLANGFLFGITPAEEVVLNVLLYYPMGYLLSAWFGKEKLWRAILIGCLCSAATEFLQYLFKMGWCETDDVMHNTLGTAIGVWVWYLQGKRRKADALPKG